MQSPILYQSSPDGYPWLSRRLGYKLHFLVLLCIVLNLCIVALVVVVQKVEIPIPDKAVFTPDGSESSRYDYKSLLPAVGNIVGYINTYIAGGGIAVLVSTYAKHQGFHKGLSLKKIRHLSLLSASGVPIGFTPLMIVGLVLAISMSLTGASIVQALTPASILVNTNGSWPIVSFQTSDTPNVRCDYQTREQGLGYGQNCPVNDKYGIMFDAGVQELVQVRANDPNPEYFTRRGVSYPTTLSGLSGRVTTMAADIVANVAGASAGTETVVLSCLPRTKVTVQCKTNTEGTGIRVTNLGETNTPFFNTQRMQFCNSSTFDENFCPKEIRTNFGLGTVFVFAENHPNEGSTSLVIAATGEYANDLGTDQLYCNVTAHESFIPIQVNGSRADEGENLNCPRFEPTVQTAMFMTNITFMSQMVMQKMQGQDGRLEILGLINATDGKTRGEMLAPALEKMLEVGATEMYDRLSTDDLVFEREYLLRTPRMVLGSRTKYGYLWVVPPALLSLCFLLGWLVFGFRRAAQAYWSPLDPGCMAVAGVAAPKDSSLFQAVNRLAGASVNHINECIIRPLRLAEVDVGHLALTMEGPDVAPPPQKGRSYGTSLPYTPTSTVPAMSPEVKPYTPMHMMTPMMSPDQTMNQQSLYNGNNGSYFPPGMAPPNTYSPYGP